MTKWESNTSTPHVMVDLETLGTRAGCAIMSIGAVQFDPDAGTIGQKFYVNLELDAQFKRGLKMQGSTLAWWFKQETAAKGALFEAASEPLEALLKFTKFMYAFQNVRLWGHGASFDPPVLEAVYTAFGKTIPWEFWNVRDTRTLFDLTGVKVENTGTKHHALDDAEAQARAVIKAVQKVKGALRGR